MKCIQSLCVPPAFEHEAARKTRCEVHIFDPTLSLGKQQELGRVKEFRFHNVGLTGEGIKVQLTSSMNMPSCPKHDRADLYSASVTCCRAHMWMHVQYLWA